MKLENVFKHLYIIWKKHLHINIIDKNPSSPPQFTINCYPYDYISTPSSTPNVLSGNIPYKQWTYIRCMADKYHLKFRFNNQEDSFNEVTFTKETINLD